MLLFVGTWCRVRFATSTVNAGALLTSLADVWQTCGFWYQPHGSCVVGVTLGVLLNQQCARSQVRGPESASPSTNEFRAETRSRVRPSFVRSEYSSKTIMPPLTKASIEALEISKAFN